MKLYEQFFVAIIVSGILFFSSCIYGKPVISVESGDAVDLGSFPANQGKNARFVLMNTGDSELRISKVSTNCVCLLYKLDSTVITPGGHAILKVHLRRRSVSGNFRKLINISSNAGTPLVLTVKGMAKSLLEVTPSPREYVGHPLPQTGYFREFQLTADRDGVVIAPPVVYGSGSKYCKAVLTPVAPRKWKLSVKMEQGEIGKVINTTVRLSIKEPRGWQPLIFSFSGRWGYELRTRPSRMIVPLNAEEKFAREFELAILGSKHLDTAKLVIPAVPGMKVSFQRLSGTRIRCRVEFDPSIVRFEPGKPLKLKFEYPDSVYGVAVFVPR